MKEITLYEAYSILQQCVGVVVEGRLIEPTLLGYEDSLDHEFMCLSWEEEYEEEDYLIEVVFLEGDNERVELDGCTMYLIGTDGEQEELTLLREYYAE